MGACGTGQAGNIYVIDPATGTATLKQSLGVQLGDGLAIGTGGTLYATGVDPISGQAELSVVPVKGSASTVPLASRILGLDWSPTDQALFGSDSSGSLFQINPSTGAAQAVPLPSPAPLRGTLGDLAFPPVVPSSLSVVYYQDFERGDGGYTANPLPNISPSPPDYWHYSTGRSLDTWPDHSLTQSWYYGQNETPQGGGSYPIGYENGGVLASPPITLPASGTSILSFSYMLGTRDALNEDVAFVSVVDPASGANSTVILSRTQGTLPQTNGGWQSAVADLSQYDGHTIQLTFTFSIVCPNPPDPEGWYVDDVAIVNSAAPASIQQSRKFNDLNASGTESNSDPGLPNWTIYVDYNNDSKLDPGDPSAVTAADGSYTITGIKPGTWTVREVPQTGWSNSYPAAGSYTETFVSGGVQTGLDFGNWTGASIRQSRKFNDLNASGTESNSDPGLPNWTIYVDYNNDSKLDPGDPSAVTAADGSYTITGIKPGTWTVREVPQTGWSNSYPAAGSYTETFVSGGVQTGLDFGNWTGASIQQSRKFNDLNASGTESNSDPGLPNWTIYVDYNNDSKLDPGDPSAVTAADGSYTITGIKPGTWTVREVPQTGWSNSYPAAGSYTETFVSGGVQTGLDFGNATPQIAGYVWNDSNAPNGQWDVNQPENEPGLNGWTVYLVQSPATGVVGAGTTPTATTFTAAVTSATTGQAVTLADGDWIQFSGNMTPGLENQQVQIQSDTNGVLTVSPALPVAPSNSDTFASVQVASNPSGSGQEAVTSHNDTSGKAGYYSFSNLTPGDTYVVRELIPQGSEQTYPGPGKNLQWIVTVPAAGGLGIVARTARPSNPTSAMPPRRRCSSSRHWAISGLAST